MLRTPGQSVQICERNAMFAQSFPQPENRPHDTVTCGTGRNYVKKTESKQYGCRGSMQVPIAGVEKLRRLANMLRYRFAAFSRRTFGVIETESIAVGCNRSRSSNFVSLSTSESRARRFGDAERGSFGGATAGTPRIGVSFKRSNGADKLRGRPRISAGGRMFKSSSRNRLKEKRRVCPRRFSFFLQSGHPQTTGG